MNPLPSPCPAYFVGYIDPSTGHVFASAGPAILAALGGAAGAVVLMFSRFKSWFISFLKNKSDKKEQKNSNPRA